MQTQRRQMRTLSGQATVEDRSGEWLNARCCRLHGNNLEVNRVQDGDERPGVPYGCTDANRRVGVRGGNVHGRIHPRVGNP